MPKTRLIEMYIGFSNGSDSGSWNTDYVDIPLKTPKKKIESVACMAMEKKLNDESVDNAAFWGIYSIPDPDEEQER